MTTVQRDMLIWVQEEGLDYNQLFEIIERPKHYQKQKATLCSNKVGKHRGGRPGILIEIRVEFVHSEDIALATYTADARLVQESVMNDLMKTGVVIENYSCFQP